MRRLLTLLTVAAALVAGEAAADSYVLAVTYFDAHSVRPELEPLGRGVADMLMTDLAQGKGVRVVERNRLNELLAELELGRSQYIDEATAQKLGDGLGATHVVVGSMTAGMDGMRLDARVVSVATGEVELSVQATGGEEEFFQLEFVLAAKLLDGLGVVEADLPVRDGVSLDEAVARARAIDETDQAYVGRLAAMREYRSRRFVRLTLESGATWGIRDGGGAPYSAFTFAERIGDQGTLDLMRKRRIAGTIIGFGFLGAGAGMFAGGMAVLAREIGASGDNDGAIVGGTVLFTTGFVFMLMAPGPRASAVGRQSYMAHYYTPEQADELIREHNEALGEELGLSREDVIQLDLQSRRTRPGPRVWPMLSFGTVGVVGVF